MLYDRIKLERNSEAGDLQHCAKHLTIFIRITESTLQVYGISEGRKKNLSALQINRRLYDEIYHKLYLPFRTTHHIDTTHTDKYIHTKKGG